MNKQLPIIGLAAIVAVVLAFFFFYSPEPQDRESESDEPEQASEQASEPVIVSWGIEIAEALGLDKENTLTLQLSSGGPVVIQLFPDKAPSHVARFKELTRTGFYDGVVFHRVIEGFMAQTGDPTGTGSGGSGQNIDAEFNDMMHLRGVVSTARAQDVNSADSQFFFMLADSAHLDGQYTAWGKVVDGMDYIDLIPKGPKEANGSVPVDEQGTIVSMRVMADVEESDDDGE